MLGGLILIGLLVVILPLQQAMILHGLIQLTSNGYRAWLNRKDISWTIIYTLVIGNVCALFGFFLVAFVPDKITVILVLGLLPYITWALPSSVLNITKKPIGLLAGVSVVGSNIISGTGGLVLDVFFQRANMTRHQVVATKAVAQSLGHIAKIIFFGLLSTPTLNIWPSYWLIAFAVASSVVGTTLGKKTLDRIDDGEFFLWTQRIILIIGAFFISYACYMMN
tara:strand:- start:3049 stop:3717 length:669 start_codon:yes stop_codon:yes gene_type:complete